MNRHEILSRVTTARRILTGIHRSAPPSFWRDCIGKADALLAAIPEPRAGWWRRVLRKLLRKGTVTA